ncbi:uncharacterized protein LOC141547329 [Sminthopsis crassicaudata]|uniref:uncharacterized protein LOC141547329 n=1 Tax=Sminthopsis crassicaudata TaxID=9301 RepID=UPI003D6854CE
MEADTEKRMPSQRAEVLTGSFAKVKESIFLLWASARTRAARAKLPRAPRDSEGERRWSPRLLSTPVTNSAGPPTAQHGRTAPRRGRKNRQGGASGNPVGTPAPTGRAWAGEPRSNRRRGRKGDGRAGGGGRGGGCRGWTLSSSPPSHHGSLGTAGVRQRFSPHLTLSQQPQPQPPQSSEPFFTSAASAASADSPRPAQEPHVTSGSGRAASCGQQSQMIGWRGWPTWASGRGRANPGRLPPGETSYTGWRNDAAAVPTYPPRSRRCSNIRLRSAGMPHTSSLLLRRSYSTPSLLAPSSLTRPLPFPSWRHPLPHPPPPARVCETRNTPPRSIPGRRACRSVRPCPHFSPRSLFPRRRNVTRPRSPGDVSGLAWGAGRTDNEKYLRAQPGATRTAPSRMCDAVPSCLSLRGKRRASEAGSQSAIRSVALLAAYLIRRTAVSGDKCLSDTELLR